ncbi:hypothetical protein [Propionispira arboris]|uniref:hypothetical protein n=1 Tax=Propionispira arboris TaxID=84035 RepID=UPI0015A4F9B4|nr:hypothetical protein [Propionispira arboris]
MIDMNIFECYNIDKEIVDVWLRRLSSTFLFEKNPLNRLGGFFHAVIYGMKEWQ